MIRQNLLPILRKWKIWLAVFLAAAAFTVSGAWLSREVARNQAEIDRTWEEMTVNFRLGPGRKSLSSTFTLKFAQIRKLIELDCYESFDLEMTVPRGAAFVSDKHPVIDLETGTVTEPPPESFVPCALIWAASPGDKYGPIPKWDKGFGMAISPALAELFGVEAGVPDAFQGIPVVDQQGVFIPEGIHQRFHLDHSHRTGTAAGIICSKNHTVYIAGH